MLSSLRRRVTVARNVVKGLSREYMTQRQQQKRGQWWAVDGEIFKAEELELRTLLEPSPNLQISNKKRRTERTTKLALTRLKMRKEEQESYWTKYMNRYQIMRDEWEKLVWDPLPRVERPATTARARNNQRDFGRGAQRYPYNNGFQAHGLDRRAGPSWTSNSYDRVSPRGKENDNRLYGSPRDDGNDRERGIEGHRYGSSYGNPYGRPYRNSYGSSYRNSYGNSYGSSYGSSYGNPYGNARSRRTGGDSYENSQGPNTARAEVNQPYKSRSSFYEDD